ncbi:putative protein DMP8 [Cocos nucifera]|uniref:CASP-like protein n=1 Tax=Cocos nucifera TaxID=13894 RepID=A0A8K0NCT3_COCNU|nr:putative protein DMP8 [Cocos nucifera]
MAAFVALCAASCVFFTFTDSFRAVFGRLYDGVATFRGIWTFNGRGKGPPEPAVYKLRWSDLFHALLSLVVFLTFAASDIMTWRCAITLRCHGRRREIGYPFLLQRDAICLRC